MKRVKIRGKMGVIVAGWAGTFLRGEAAMRYLKEAECSRP